MRPPQEAHDVRHPASRPLDAPAAAAAATQLFVAHRELLFSIVYNLLGSVADTEDVLASRWDLDGTLHRAG
jgi:hypothetical protein